ATRPSTPTVAISWSSDRAASCAAPDAAEPDRSSRGSVFRFAVASKVLVMADTLGAAGHPGNRCNAKATGRTRTAPSACEGGDRQARGWSPEQPRERHVARAEAGEGTPAG